MKKNIIGKIIVAIVIVIMIIPIVIEGIEKNALTSIKFSQLDSTVEKTNNFEFALVYVGTDNKEAKMNIKKLVDKYDTKNVPTSAYYMDTTKLTSEEKTTLFGNGSLRTGYIFIANGEIVKTETKALETEKLESYVKAFTGQGVDDSIKAYKVAENANEFKNAIKDKKNVTMAVFGRDTCYYCNQYKPIYNTVASEYDVNIYYFDRDNYSEYDKILDMGLKIPAACSKSGSEAELKDGYDTPLTLFTKNGKVIDCIGEYVNKQKLITKLKTVGMIKE